MLAHVSNQCTIVPVLNAKDLHMLQRTERCNSLLENSEVLLGSEYESLFTHFAVEATDIERFQSGLNARRQLKWSIAAL